MNEPNQIEKILSSKKFLLQKNKRLRNQCLDQINLNAAGIDVGSRSHFVAVPTDRDEEPVKEFNYFTEDLHQMAKWLKSCQITTIAMESTGVH